MAQYLCNFRQKSANQIMLKKIIFSALIFCISTCYVVANDAIVSAFNRGDVATIASYLNANVELSIERTENIFTKQQTQTILQDFFRKNRPQEFEVEHRETQGSQIYIFGELETAHADFSVFIIINNDLIQKLRIEQTND